MEDNIHYLKGVIDTLKDIINNNTNIQIKLPHIKISEDKQDDDKVEVTSKLDTAKNYIILLEKLKDNRVKTLQHIEICDYILNLDKSLIEIEDKLRQRGLDDKKIHSLIKTKFLKPFELKLLLLYKYEDIQLTREEIIFLQDCNKLRYNYKNYKVFNKEKFFKTFLNYTISIFDIKYLISVIINNPYCNLKYIDQYRSNLDDPFSFYYIEKIENDKIYWKMDCRLDTISNELREYALNYCIDLFRKIYHQIFHDNDYREDYERQKDILDSECSQLLKNIKLLSCKYTFTKEFQQILIDCKTEEEVDKDKFLYNLKSDDKKQKQEYKELINNVDKEFESNIRLLFEDITKEQINNLLIKII